MVTYLRGQIEQFDEDVAGDGKSNVFTTYSYLSQTAISDTSELWVYNIHLKQKLKTCELRL